MEAYEVGQYGEALVRAMLAEVGETQAGGPSDVLFMGCAVEVKAARPSKYNGRTYGYQFCLYKEAASGKVKTDFRKAAVLVLVCLDAQGAARTAFVIPTARIGDQKHLTIPLSLESRFSPYREKWTILEEYVT